MVSALDFIQEIRKELALQNQYAGTVVRTEASHFLLYPSNSDVQHDSYICSNFNIILIISIKSNEGC